MRNGAPHGGQRSFAQATRARDAVRRRQLRGAAWRCIYLPRLAPVDGPQHGQPRGATLLEAQGGAPPYVLSNACRVVARAALVRDVHVTILVTIDRAHRDAAWVPQVANEVLVHLPRPAARAGANAVCRRDVELHHKMDRIVGVLPWGNGAAPLGRSVG